MKRLIILILAAAILTACASAAADPEPVRYSITEVVDTCYTPPDTYEVLYRTTFSNGLAVESWTLVTKEEYERIGEE